MTNCPNCNAPIVGGQCEYCGTVFENSDFEFLKAKQKALIDADEIRYLYAEAIKAMREYRGEIV